jgi:hypothetical protein
MYEEKQAYFDVAVLWTSADVPYEPVCLPAPAGTDGVNKYDNIAVELVGKRIPNLKSVAQSLSR